MSGATPLLSLDAVKLSTTSRLDKLFQAKMPLARQIDEEYAELIDELGRFLVRGGKRLRPYLAYLGYAACRGKKTEAMLDAAISQELYHAFLLIHDDIIDRDLKRWGGQNISGVYTDRFSLTLPSHEARHFGDSIAILAGDITCGLAGEAILASDFDDTLKVAAMTRMQRMIFEIGGGEQLDVILPLLGEGAVTKDRLLKIARYKTASYSFEATLQLGSILAGAEAQTIESMSDYAIPLGIAFQLRDDYLSLYGNENQLGKPTLGDLREGKRTLLIEYALHDATSKDRDELLQYLGNASIGYPQLGRTREIVEKCGAKSRIITEAQNYATEAAESLDGLDLDPAAVAELQKLAFLVTERQA